MSIALRAIVILLLFTACAPRQPLTEEQRADIAARNEAREALIKKAREEGGKLSVAPVTECVSFLESGTFEPENLISAGFEPYSHTFRAGTGYRLTVSEKSDLTVNMIEAGSTEKVSRCALTARGSFGIGRALERIGFKAIRSPEGVVYSRGDLDLTLTGLVNVRGVYRSPFGPRYFTIKRAEKERA